MVASSPSRNAPCHCGSGRRFKECHGRLPGREGHGQDVASLMQRALALQVDGRLDEAAGLYLDVLGVADTTFDALHMLGVIRHQQQRFDEALALFDRAL
ncbi:MAG TPA: SEC-C metal-binding domain-containing protein, partial [Casimicrobiaceae bacterium]|nr:SEC-C metal-binding domain-containing protein [Casimicrobiaceae bacterium]